MIRVTFVHHLPNPEAPTAEDLKTGTDLTEHMTFTRAERPVSLVLLPHPRRFEVARWPDGLVKVREIDPEGDEEGEP